MIDAILGLPGDGKSYKGTGDIIEKLVVGRVFCVTTVPLLLPRLREYVVEERERRFGKEALPFDLDENLLVLKKSEAAEFYRYRSGGLVLAESPDRHILENRNMSSLRLPREKLVEWMDREFEKMNADPKFSRGCEYWIDEAHNVFSSREWATNGRATLYYASQHRHLHDNVHLLTQVFDNVEKQLRTLVSEVHVCRNYINRSVGPFRMRPCMKVRSFYGNDPNRVLPYHTDTLYLDIGGIGACYETTGALGVHVKPEARHQRGFLPWWSAWAIGASIVLLCAAMVGFLPRMFFSHIGFIPKHSDAAKAVVAATVAPIGAASSSVSAPVIRPYSGIQTFGDHSVLAYLPSRREWVPGVPIGGGAVRLEDGTFARPEMVNERDARVKNYDISPPLPPPTLR